MIPIQKNSSGLEEVISISVELFKPKSKPRIIPEPIIKPELKPVEKEVVKKPVKTKALQPKPKVSKAMPIAIAPTVIEKTIKKLKKQLPSSGTIFNSISNKEKFITLGKDFQAKTAEQDDFKFKTFEQPEWNMVTKLINEEVDKPQYEMNFYSDGIEGSVERFMDKITYKKRFTTKYGTKIDCVAVAAVIIVGCGWK